MGLECSLSLCCVVVHCRNYQKVFTNFPIEGIGVASSLGLRYMELLRTLLSVFFGKA